jgi:hypothetical protein
MEVSGQLQVPGKVQPVLLRENTGYVPVKTLRKRGKFLPLSDI